LVQAGFSHHAVTSLYLSLHVLVGSLALTYLRVPETGRTVVVVVVLLVLLFLTRGVLWAEARAERRNETEVGSALNQPGRRTTERETQAPNAEHVHKEEEALRGS
jgi:ABC-type siderophore export system fused ATPase/permease subunit